MKILEEKQLKAFGQHLKLLRKKYKFTQESLAEAADMDLAHLARIETAKRNPKLTTLVTIAHGMKIPLGELMDFKAPKK